MARDPLDLDELLALTENALRRELLFLLLEEESVSLTEAKRSLGIATDDVRSLELSHVHLPKLEGAGVITVEDDEVARGPAFDEVDQLLRWLQKHRDTDD